jgi:hypothetical protein
MSERSRYEEMDEQFNDLPMPDDEASWQKMKELLDDDDDNIVPPPVFLRSCLGWGILLLVGLTIAWLVVRPEKWWSETSEAKQTSSSKTTRNNVTKENVVERKDVPSSSSTGSNEANDVSVSKTKMETVSTTNPANYQVKRGATMTIVEEKKNNYNRQNGRPILVGKEQPQSINELTNKEDNSIHSDTVITRIENQPTKIFDNTQKQNAVTPGTAAPSDTAKTQTIIPATDSTKQNKPKQLRKKFLLAAGIGEQQQIPIAGQTAVPYSHYGRKSSLSDYVPSVYVQLQKEKKWFIQAEFRYGAAQSVREFSYNRNTKFDTFSKSITITTMRLKKTYYHQLPLSFNYYVVPNLSVGIGGMYSRFLGAVSEKETINFNTITQATTTSKQIVPIKHFNDSFLYKTQVHALIQATYQWKRFAFELRYTKDIQPYIKYTKPDGTVDEEKNQSLQFIARYRLWRSRE